MLLINYILHVFHDHNTEMLSLTAPGTPRSERGNNIRAHTHKQPATSSSKRDRQKEPRAKKAVVALAAAWPSRLQRVKCILISILNATS